MQPLLFTPEQKTVTLLRITTLTLPQISEKLNLGFNNGNKALYLNIGKFTGVENVTAMLVLGVGVASGEITPAELQLVFAPLSQVNAT